MSPNASNSSAEVLAGTYTISAKNIYASKSFLIDHAKASKLIPTLAMNVSKSTDSSHLVLPYDPVPMAMLVSWLTSGDFSLEAVHSTWPDLRPEYDDDSEEDAVKEEDVDEIEALYWLCKLAYDLKLIELQSTAAQRYLGALRIGHPVLAGELWDRLDDVYPSKSKEREALHSLTALVVKKLTRSYTLACERAATEYGYRHDLGMIEDQIYELEWRIADRCWELRTAGEGQSRAS